jgi:aromatic-L-amino-acid decarboxylase
MESAGPTQVELEVIDWFRGWLGLPDGTAGVLVNGGSSANLTALLVAREAAGGPSPDSVVYVSDQAHSSLARTARAMGLRPQQVRVLPTDDRWRLAPDTVAAAVRADRDAGRIPFALCASAGSTNTGAVDPLAECADLSRQEGLWLHVDGAYGGFFQLTERGRALFRGIENADSIVLDPHKGMFLPYGTGCLLVREGHRLREAHHVGAEYLQDLALEDEIPNFTDYSPELSRDFRGLRVWLPIKLHGLGAFRAALDEKLDLTQYLYEELRAVPGFELRWKPQLTVVAFRYLPRRGDAEAFNRRLLDRIIASQRVFLSSTMVEGRFTIRSCILSHRTHRDRIEEAAEIIKRSAKELEEDL